MNCTIFDSFISCFDTLLTRGYIIINVETAPYFIAFCKRHGVIPMAGARYEDNGHMYRNIYI